MIINFVVPLRANGQPARRRQFIAAYWSFKAISRRRNRGALQRGSLIANVANAAVFARKFRIAF